MMWKQRKREYTMNEIETKEYYDFVLNHPNTHFMQGPEWAKIKGNWKITKF